jgi:short-subunit dehydrogenase
VTDVLAGRALVTGASVGIGRSFATALAARGHDLVLVARDGAALSTLACSLEDRYGVSAEVLVADLVTDRLAAVEERLVDTVSPVTMLVNNAGFGTYGQFAELDVDGEEREVRLNVLALVRLTHAALGVMQPRGEGSIVNVSSIAGYQPIPGSATYAATKAFVTSFTHAVHQEARPFGVRVLAVCPGFTRTEFHARAGTVLPVPAFAWMSADRVVDVALRDLDRGRAVSIPGPLNLVLAALASSTPAGITRRISGFAGHRRH